MKISIRKLTSPRLQRQQRPIFSSTYIKPILNQHNKHVEDPIKRTEIARIINLPIKVLQNNFNFTQIIKIKKEFLTSNYMLIRKISSQMPFKQILQIHKNKPPVPVEKKLPVLFMTRLKSSFILAFRPIQPTWLIFIQLALSLPVKPWTCSRNGQKARLFIKQSKMTEARSLLRQSTEYNTSGLDTQKPSTRQYIPGECTGKWSDEEHMKYIAFLDANKEVMKSKEKRRSNKFYREMADFIQTRNPLQCRSHHQKLEVKYIHPIKIVSYFRQQFDAETYKEIKQGLMQNKKTKLMPKQIKTTRSQNLEGNVKIETTDEQPYFPFSQSLPFIQMASYPSPTSLYMSVPYNWVQPVFAYGFEFN